MKQNPLLPLAALAVLLVLLVTLPFTGAAAVYRQGSRGTEVRTIQTKLKIGRASCRERV